MVAAYARLVSFEAEPEIAAALFTVDSDSPDADDLEIRTAKLPYYRELGDGEENLRWFIQATASYLDMEDTLRLELSSDYTERLDASWEGFGVHKYALGLLGIVGSDVHGWNLNFSYDY